MRVVAKNSTWSRAKFKPDNALIGFSSRFSLLRFGGRLLSVIAFTRLRLRLRSSKQCRWSISSTLDIVLFAAISTTKVRSLAWPMPMKSWRLLLLMSRYSSFGRQAKPTCGGQARVSIRLLLRTRRFRVGRVPRSLQLVSIFLLRMRSCSTGNLDPVNTLSKLFSLQSCKFSSVSWANDFVPIRLARISSVNLPSNKFLALACSSSATDCPSRTFNCLRWKMQ
mmetsp:Transcript_1773/g.3831  ORF Transcript_1773/g.3831 Transcript_1773/m.3831 type:complete len:223 (-) Transcript_1773:2701-3369(-)